MTDPAPTIYLADAVKRGLFTFTIPPPALRLVLADYQAERTTLAAPTRPEPSATVAELSRPALLVSFVYLEGFLKHRGRYYYRNWVLDSGAFSAARSGAPVDLTAYTETCQELLANDPTLVEVYALDVIGDWRASLKNTEAMWRAGVPAIPCFHVGEPEDALLGIARDYPKIALGGAVGLRGPVKRAWAAQCFSRVWPHRVHGFGFGAKWATMEFPFHSIDASNWELGPSGFGNWKTFGQLTVRGWKDLRAEVVWHLRVEHEARQKWAALWAKHPTLCEPLPREVSQ